MRVPSRAAIFGCDVTNISKWQNGGMTLVPRQFGSSNLFRSGHILGGVGELVADVIADQGVEHYSRVVLVLQD